MKISLNWLSEYIDIAHLNTGEISDMLTFAGVEVEDIQEKGVRSPLIVIAQIKEATQHPQADKLKVCKVDVGNGELQQIVCGAQNYKVGDKVPCALPGAVLPGNFEINVGMLRGIESRGMLCSASELGMDNGVHGLWILPEDASIGMPIMEMIDSDTIIEVEITPNRPDLLSHWGMARELGAITGCKLFTDPAHAIAETAQTTSANDFIRLDAPELCPLFTAVKIEGVTVAPSPEWLCKKLTAIGLRPINNIVDITNYVLHELGHPLHAFDANKIQGNIVIRTAAQGESLKCLDGHTYSLDCDDLVVSDTQGSALSIAGIMGGEGSSVNDLTKNIILEAAWFLPSKVRSTSRKLALSSDSSYRFERGTSAWSVLRASARATQLILELAGGKASPILVTGDAPHPDSAVCVVQGTDAKIRSKMDVITMHMQALDAYSGGAIPHDEAQGILERLGCSYDSQKAEWLCPPWRLDLQRPCDLIEEIVRVYGLDKIPARYEAPFSATTKVDLSYDFQMKIRQSLAVLGFWETQTIKLIAESALDGTIPQAIDAMPPRPLMEGDLIRVALPLSEDHSIMRPSHCPGLLAAAVRNVNFGCDSLRFFEIGKIFRHTGGGKGRDQEMETLGILLAGKSTTASWSNNKPNQASFEDLTAVLAQLFPNAQVSLQAARPRDNVAIGADVYFNGKNVGFFSRLSLERCRSLGLPEAVYYTGLDLNKIQEIVCAPIKAQKLPQFPGSSRDAAMNIPIEVSNADIQKVIASAKQPLLASFSCFDVFSDPTGEKLSADRKSIAYSFLYRSAEKTLTTQEVDQAHQQVLAHLTKQIKTLSFR